MGQKVTKLMETDSEDDDRLNIMSRLCYTSRLGPLRSKTNSTQEMIYGLPMEGARGESLTSLISLHRPLPYKCNTSGRDVEEARRGRQSRPRTTMNLRGSSSNKGTQLHHSRFLVLSQLEFQCQWARSSEEDLNM